MDSTSVQFAIMRDIFISEYQDYLDLTKEKNELFKDAATLANEINEIRSKFDYAVSAEQIKKELDKKRAN